MLFVGSTAFTNEVVTPLHISPAADVSKEQDATGSFVRMADTVRVFVDLGLPALASAAEGHDVVHYVFCDSALPSDLQEELRNATARHSFTTFVTLENFDEPYELDQERPDRIGLRHAVSARFWLHPSDIVSQNFFDTISRYSTPEYSGLDLVLPLEPQGWLTENRCLFLSPNEPISDGPHVIQLRSSKRDAIRTLAPLHQKSELVARRPNIVDGSAAGRLRLSPGRTVALWREPSQAEFPWRDTSHEQRTIIRDAFSMLAEDVVFDRQFELHFEGLNQDVWVAKFPLATRGFTLDLRLRSQLSSMNGVYVSYELIDNDGQPISPETDIEGIGRSANPEIGHCFTSDTEEGDFRILRHVRTPSGVFCKGLKLTKKTGGELVIDTASISFKLKEKD